MFNLPHVHHSTEVCAQPLLDQPSTPKPLPVSSPLHARDSSTRDNRSRCSPYRVRLLCTCKHLHNLESQVLQLDDVAVQLADLRQAMAWAAWLARHRDRVGRLAMQLPPPDARGWTQGLHTIQRAPWLWLALSGSPSLTHVTWNAMARDTRRPFYQHMSVG